MSAEISDFRKRLRILRHRWIAGLAVAAILRLAGWMAVVISVCGLLDFFLAFSELEQKWIAAIVATVAIALTAKCFVELLRLGDEDAARRADRLLGSRRQAALSALDLERRIERGVDIPDLEAYLCRQGIERALLDLQNIRFVRTFPFREIVARLRVAVLQLAIGTLLFASNPLAGATVVSRLFMPWRDIPPYSTLVFSVTPEQPAVVYGGAADISARITGAPVRSQVWFRTRFRGQTHRAVCFQESESRYTHRIEKAVNPVDFCFAVGRMRSRWHRVDLLLQPEIASVVATLTPPPYTGLPRRDILLSRDDLAGYRFTKINLRVISNRPLRDGKLVVRPHHNPSDETVVEGTAMALNTVVFKWTMKDEAELECAVRDVRGAWNREPLKIAQKIIPDRPPAASLDEPPVFSLATPTSRIPVGGEVTDDLALRRVDIVRAVVGYRDRALSVAGAETGASYRFDRKIDLSILGVAPGQILEFYIEAADSNPAMTGISQSDIASVQVISEEEYAALIRARMTLEDFLARYEQSQANTEKLVRALESLKRALESGNKDEIEKALREARETNRRVTEMLDAIAKDFPVYDLEEKLADALSGLVKLLRKQDDILFLAHAPYAGLSESVAAMIDELGGPSLEIKTLTGQAREATSIGKVMECAVRFKEIIRKQSDLVRRLERFVKETPTDKSVLGELGRRQSDIHAELTTLTADLRRYAEALDDRYAALKNSALVFADAANKMEIPDLMQKASNAALNQDGPLTLRWATLAMERLRDLLSNQAGAGFGSLCKGDGICFNVGDALRATLEQMLAALAGRVGGEGRSGFAGATGGGIVGGDVNDGYWSGGYSSLNMTVYGPERMLRQTTSLGITGSETGGRGGTGKSDGVAVTEQMGSVPDGNPVGRGNPLEQVPEPYREAVKRYFSTEERP